jgi:hypothetical protein
MSAHSTLAASTLSSLTQQLRATELKQETQSQACRAKALSRPELEASKEGLGAARQIAMARLLAAIDGCDLLAAEEALRSALKYSAGIQGLEQAQAAMPACA